MAYRAIIWTFGRIYTVSNEFINIQYYFTVRRVTWREKSRGWAVTGVEPGKSEELATVDWAVQSTRRRLLIHSRFQAVQVWVRGRSQGGCRHRGMRISKHLIKLRDPKGWNGTKCAPGSTIWRSGGDEGRYLKQRRRWWWAAGSPKPAHLIPLL